MKCPMVKTAKENTMETSFVSAPAESKVLHKDSPKKEPAPVKPRGPPTGSPISFLSMGSNTSAGHNKGNSTGRDHNGTLDEYLEDSGYLSLQNSQIDHHGDEENHFISGIHQGRTGSLENSPLKCQERTRLLSSGSQASSTPVDRPKRSTAALSSTPTNQHVVSHLPILKFQQDACEELAKSYKKTGRFDWEVITKVAEEHLLDRIIGRHIGLEYIDMFTSLLSRNMKSILTNILALLGDLDLISCRKVSKTWKKIICEDSAAMKRWQQAEQALRESKSSQRQLSSGLTRDGAASRVVLSCMQALASPSTLTSAQSSSTHSCRSTRRSASNQCTRFNEYVQAASTLMQHESLRHCRRCGSPATHSAEVQRAKCTRLSCLFDFCTRCQEPFHGSTPCRTVKSRSSFTSFKATPIIPGSARSKRNIRRL